MKIWLFVTRRDVVTAMPRAGKVKKLSTGMRWVGKMIQRLGEKCSCDMKKEAALKIPDIQVQNSCDVAQTAA